LLTSIASAWWLLRSNLAEGSVPQVCHNKKNGGCSFTVTGMVAISQPWHGLLTLMSVVHLSLL